MTETAQRAGASGDAEEEAEEDVVVEDVEVPRVAALAVVLSLIHS